jgi:hypothetical protein
MRPPKAVCKSSFTQKRVANASFILAFAGLADEGVVAAAVDAAEFLHLNVDELAGCFVLIPDRFGVCAPAGPYSGRIDLATAPGTGLSTLETVDCGILN